MPKSKIKIIIAFAALYLIWGSTYLANSFRDSVDPAPADGGHAISFSPALSCTRRRGLAAHQTFAAR